MKSTSTVALIIGMWVFSGWGWEITQAAEPSVGSSFEELCLQQASLSEEVRKTVEVLLEAAGTSDCELAANNLLTRTELDLTGKGITDITPISELTNLEVLNLSYNQITDITPISELTNLKELDLYVNQITDITPISELTNLKE
ncbi:MAG: leucine-rich repeat domain-containing protein, partial [Symploca sp. SIO3E6]|nr:leucine-rich repeat domain-containing protein [Caldora sp. SIO3E6]